MGRGNVAATRSRDRSVLVFGRGPVADHVSRRLLESRCRVIGLGRTQPPPIQLDGALVSLEELATSACALSLNMFAVVEALERSRELFPAAMPRVVVVMPPPSTAAPARVGLRLAKTLALYLGAPTRVRFNVIERSDDRHTGGDQETADLAVMLLKGMLDGARDRVFRIGTLGDETKSPRPRTGF